MQNNSIHDASNYLVDTWRRYKDDGEKLCNYGIALAAYALASSPATSNVTQQMLVELKSRIQKITGKAMDAVTKLYKNYFVAHIIRWNVLYMQ